MAALQTPAGSGGIAVIRVSGPGARAIVAGVFTQRTRPGAALDGHRLALGEVRDGDSRLDEALVALVPSPAGQAVEINIHGGPRVAQRVLERLARAGAVVTDAPSAEPEAWPLAWADLDNPGVGVEMLHCLPRARTHLALDALTCQWRAGLSRLARRVIQGAPPPPGTRWSAELRRAADALPRMRRLLEPPEVVLAGPPNVGKSTLANALLGRPACIVSDTPGTTRDWVRELADLSGLAVWLTDTAGLWSPADPLDAQAVARAWARVDQADLVLAVRDAAEPEPHSDPVWRRLTDRPTILRVAARADRLALANTPPRGTLAVSAQTGAGLDALRRAVAARLGLADLDPAHPMAFTARQAALLTRAADALDQANPAQAAAALDELLR